MNIKKWLAAIVVFLLAPSLLFAGLWVKNSLIEVNHLDRGLAALAVVEQMDTLIRQRISATDGSDLPTAVDLAQALNLSDPERDQVSAAYADFRLAKSLPQSMQAARTLVRTVLQSAKLSSVTSHGSAELTSLIADTLPRVILESSAMVHGGERLAHRDEINLWDKISVPVQAGQFKVAADMVSRVARTYFNMLPSGKSAHLIELANQYEAANGIYQTASASLLMSTIDAKTGGDIDQKPVAEAFPQLADAVMNLWSGTASYLTAELREQRQVMRLGVGLAAAVGVLVILATLGLAVIFSRALANRTLQEFENLGFHDPLTGLPNRRGLMKTLDTLASGANHGQIALMILDIRHFKAINNRFGDRVGDSVLRSVAGDLSRTTSVDDFFARTGGTEFMVLRKNATNIRGFEKLASDIVANLASGRMIGGSHIRLDGSVGYTISAPGAMVSEQLIMDATLALRAAKKRKTQTIYRFTPEMRAEFEHNSEIAKDLIEALQNGHIVPWYQPQICARTGAFVGAEALVRWVDNNDVRYPGAFLPAAHEAGYMDRLDTSVRQQALAMAARLKLIATGQFHIGLNVAANLLADPTCVDLLLYETDLAGLQPNQVSIEILEAVMIDEFAAAPIKANIARLSELGFFIELDDFGTGHSSITSLRDLKINRVKIDRSFVAGVDIDPELQKFTRALIQLARSLDIEVLAEGVETQGEWDWLAAHDCDVIQGFLISKAVPEAELTKIAAVWSKAGQRQLPQTAAF